ncbi:hypothetical protein DYB37_008319, partial [Aphanomyces astaci]
MLENLMRGLERDNQAWVLDQGGKTVVDNMVKAIKPLGLQKSVQRLLALQRNKPLKSNVYRFLDWLGMHITGYHLYTPQWTSPARPTPEQDSAKYERKKGTSLKCGSENHKVSARNKKVTKLQGSANKSLGREANIEAIVSVTTILLDTGPDVTLVTAGVMKSLERAAVEVKVISPEPSVIQPYGQAPALKVDHQKQFKLVTLDTP